jgi:cellulose synthase/poly-beta-1,6-N-acetylglucosamine synthase-like glycosyltransferase
VVDFLIKTSLALLVLHYLGYPLAMLLAANRARARSSASESARERATTVPSITFIIAAYNEERVLAAKLRNTLSLEYPRSKMQVIVAAQGSTDGTAAIAGSFAGEGVLVLHSRERRGKTAALNEAVAASTGELLVFSDANNEFEKTALARLTAHFAAPQIGGVTGLKQIRPSGDREASVGDGLYWKYEAAIKTAESELGSITAADGEIFAMRRELFRPMDPSLINDDAALTLAIVQAGKRLVYDPTAKSFEDASITIGDDFNVKVRMVSGGFQTLHRNWRFLFSPWEPFAWKFFFHKTLRWTAPEFLILLFVGTATQLHQPKFAALFLAQCLFYSTALLGAAMRWLTGKIPRALYVPFYFCAMNLAALLGLYRYLSGTTTWRKALR